jgi:catechol 2,3-dioxygenase-like lactoylglutathione lyase family enzyme
VRRLPRLLRPALLALVLLSAAAAAAQQPLVSAVGPIGMTVSDMDRSVEFYSRVLHFQKISDQEVAGEQFERLKGVFGARARVVRLQLGEEQVELTEYLAPRGQPVPADFRSNDRWFQHIAIIVRDMDKAYAWLRQNKVAHASSGPQTLPDWNPNAGGIKAFYFRDPDGHHLEILEFPRGKGDPKWQTAVDSMFLGIDHTAIVVADTDASLAFYRDVLGMQVAGESENHGAEQEHLNSVFGARLRITALRAAGGPGIELLEYLAPRDGRPYPSTARANDLFHWEVHLVADADAAWQRLRAAKAHFISPGPQQVGGAGALLVRDPDGHALALGAHASRTERTAR